MSRDYYEVLGVAPDATRAEIIAAYRKLAMTIHPDRGGGTDQFQELKKAYEVLRDAERRQRYDAGKRDSVENEDSIRRREALQEIAKLLMAAINDDTVNLDQINLVKLAYQAIDRRIASVQNDIKELQRQIRRRENALRRLRTKRPSKNDVVRSMIEASIRTAKSVIEDAKRDISRSEMMRTILDDYDYAADFEDEVAEALHSYVAKRLT